MSTGIRNTVIVLVYTGLESSCKDWKQRNIFMLEIWRYRLESSCKDWKHDTIADLWQSMKGA